MKRTLLFLFAVIVALNVNAQSIKWYSFEEASKLVRDNPGKKIFIDLYTDWCGWCKVMDRTTFADTVVAKYMTDHYYAVKFNAEGKDPVKFYGPVMKYDSLKKEKVVVNDTIVFKYDPSQGRNGTHGLALALTDGKLAYPTFVVLDDKFQRLDIISGYQQAPAFETQINYFGSNSYLTIPFDQFTKTFTPKAQPPAQTGAPGGH